MSHLFNNPDNGGQVHLAGIILRKPKIGNGGIGGGGKKNVREMKRSGPLAFRSETSKRGREERILKLMKQLVIQEVHEGLGVDVHALRKMELDHIHGRDCPGFEPFGSILSPINLQLVTHDQHTAKTNALEGPDQRKDYRNTIIQERMTDLNRRLIQKLGPVFTLQELRDAIESMIYDHGKECEFCEGE